MTGVLRAVQFLHAFDHDPARARAFDLRTHLDQEIREVFHFGFRRGAVDHSNPLGEHGGHHDIVRAEYGRTELAAQVHGTAAEFAGEDFDVARFDAVHGAERLEAFQVKIDGTIADDATARQRNGGLFLAAEQGPEHADRGAHLADDFMALGAWVVIVSGLGGDHTAGPFDLRAEMRENLQHVMDVAEIGHMMDDARLLGQQCRCEDGERGVFRSADFDAPAEGGAAVNEDFIHKLRR